jgi:hypothetical protein
VETRTPGRRTIPLQSDEPWCGEFDDHDCCGADCPRRLAGLERWLCAAGFCRYGGGISCLIRISPHYEDSTSNRRSNRGGAKLDNALVDHMIAAPATHLAEFFDFLRTDADRGSLGPAGKGVLRSTVRRTLRSLVIEAGAVTSLRRPGGTVCDSGVLADPVGHFACLRRGRMRNVLAAVNALGSWRWHWWLAHVSQRVPPPAVLA